MELRVLRYFLAVAREQNIPAAAERLYLSQPTLSKQLMDLEKNSVKIILNIFSTHNLIRNVAIMVEEGLGCAISISNLVNTNGTNLLFRPFEPTIKAELLLAWKKYQVFSKAAEYFLKNLQTVMAKTSSE